MYFQSYIGILCKVRVAMVTDHNVNKNYFMQKALSIPLHVHKNKYTQAKNDEINDPMLFFDAYMHKFSCC